MADGDHGQALIAYLDLPRRAMRPLPRWVEARRNAAFRARKADDVGALRQLQTRISVITSELAGRRRELGDRVTRRSAPP